MGRHRTQFVEEIVAMDCALRDGVGHLPFADKASAIAYRHRLNRARRTYRQENGATKWDALMLTVEPGTEGRWFVTMRTVRGNKLEYINGVTGEVEFLKTDTEVDHEAYAAELQASVEGKKLPDLVQEALARHKRIEEEDARAEEARKAGKGLFDE